MIEIVAFGDTIIVNYQLSIVHYLALQRSDKLEFEPILSSGGFTIFTKFSLRKKYLCEYYKKLNFLHFLGCFYGTFCIQ